jgi:hypothetical protein
MQQDLTKVLKNTTCLLSKKKPMECTIFASVIETNYNFLNKNLKLYTIVIVP